MCVYTPIKHQKACQKISLLIINVINKIPSVRFRTLGIKSDNIFLLCVTGLIFIDETHCV